MENTNIIQGNLVEKLVGFTQLNPTFSEKIVT